MEITESKLEQITKDITGTTISSRTGFYTDLQWEDAGNIVDAILAELDIKVVPDPSTEPEGAVIVMDKDGDIWYPDGHGRWFHGGCETGWTEMMDAYGPVTIYRKEEF